MSKYGLPLLTLLFSGSLCALPPAAAATAKSQLHPTVLKTRPAQQSRKSHGATPRYERFKRNKDYRLKGKTYRIIRTPQQYSATGIASWYGKEFQGRRTASGEYFDPNAFTAAHPSLPIPCYVRVTNLKNGRHIIVRVNDRGPYKSGRIIDLSRAAGKKLAINGIAKVRVDYIDVRPDGALAGPGALAYQRPAKPKVAAARKSALKVAATTQAERASTPSNRSAAHQTARLIHQTVDQNRKLAQNKPEKAMSPFRSSL